MHHGLGYGTGPQERVHQHLQQPNRSTGVGQPEKCPYEAYAAQIPDCCAAAAAAAAAAVAVQDLTGYDTRCYDECHQRTPYQDDTYSQFSGDNDEPLTSLSHLMQPKS